MCEAEEMHLTASQVAFLAWLLGLTAVCTYIALSEHQILSVEFTFMPSFY